MGEPDTAPDLRRAYLVLFVVGLASLVTAMTLSIVFVVYPALIDAFPEASGATLSWTLNVFTIVGAPMLIVASAVGERVGRRRTLLIGLVFFAVTSVMAALSPSPAWIIASRALQAIATAMILPMTASLIMREFPESHRGIAGALWSGIGGVAAALGPSLGGWLVDTWSWRAAFWMNVPTCIIVAILCYWLIDESKNPDAPRVPDLVSVFALMFGIGLFVFGLVQSPQWGWAHGGVIGAIALGLALLWFLFRRSGRHRTPLIDLELFRDPTFSLGNMAVLLFAMSFFGAQFATILFLTQVWDYTLVQAGLLATPVFALTALLSPVAGRIADRYGDEQLGAPAVFVWSVGLFALAIALRSDRNLALWFAATGLTGIGAGLTWGGVFGLVLRRATPEKMSLAAGIAQTVQRIGNAIGVAVAITVLGSRTTDDVDDHRRTLAAMAVVGVLSFAALVTMRRRARAGAHAAISAVPVRTRS